MPVIGHLTSTSSFGGPERQMLGLASSLSSEFRSVFLLFDEGGRCQSFATEIERSGFAGNRIGAGIRNPLSIIDELSELLRSTGVDILCCHGYKADLFGLLASRRVGIRAISVSRGWTAATGRVRLNERADKLVLRFMDAVICVSEAQAVKVRKCGVQPNRIRVIRNAVHPERFPARNAIGAARLREFFAFEPIRIIGAAGRLSPEKGFDTFVEAARALCEQTSFGFVIFGEGPQRPVLERQIRAAGLAQQIVLAGHRTDLDELLPHLDLIVLPSRTEGLPNVALEALAAGVPVVATAVGGTPEVVQDGVSGYLVPPDDPAALADRVAHAVATEARRLELGRRGSRYVRESFSFEAQTAAYVATFDELMTKEQD
jgi:glycosyltransferase involved in cell wall biosynthesis